MKKGKIELISLEEKKDAQILQDMSLTPEQRFVRMFDLIEFNFAFSPRPKIHDEHPGKTVIVLRRLKK